MADPAPVANPIEVRFGSLSKYHYFAYSVFFLSKVPALWHVFNTMILNPKITYTCPGVENGTNHCPCSNPTWDRSAFTETAQTKFGLICDQAYIVKLSETLAYFGMLCGALIFGVLADKCGRIISYSASYTLGGVVGILVGLSPNLIAFLIFRYFEGVSAGGTIVTSFVLTIEYTGPKLRETMTALYHFPINVGHLTIAGVSYFISDYKMFQIAISIPMFVFGLSFLYVAESPLWLLDNNKKERTIKTMEKIARCNNKPDPTIREDIEVFYANRPQNNIVRIQAYHIFKYRKLTINFLCMAYMYFVCGMGYYGVSQYISKMSENVHANIAISALLTIPATFSSIYLLNKIGRKPLLMGSILGAALFMFIAVVIFGTFKPSWVKVLFACVSNCFFFLAFIVVFLYGVEMFPTQVRNSVLGSLSLLSRAGMISSPLINAMSQTASGIAYTVLALVGAGLVTLLPETKNRKLPSDLEEAENMFRGGK